jgi:MFS family permease
MSLSAFLLFMNFYFLLPTLPMYLSSHFNADKTEVGWLLGSFTLSALLTRPLFAYFLDKGHKRALLLGSFLLFSLLTIPYAFAPTITLFFAVRILHGSIWGGTTISSASTVVDFVPQVRRGEGLGIYGVGITAAMASGPLFALSVVSGSNFLPVFLIASVIGLLGFLSALAIRFSHSTLIVPQPAASNPNSRSSGFTFETLLERRALPVGLNTILMAFCYGGLVSFVPLYAKEIGIPNPGSFFLIFAAGLAVSRVVAGKSFDKRGPRPAGTTAFAAMAVGFVTLAAFKSHVGFFVAASILGLSQGLLTPTFQAMVNDLVPRERRAAGNSTYFTAFDIGIAAGSISVGILADRIGLAGTFLVCGALCLIALALFLGHTVPHFRRTRTQS